MHHPERPIAAGLAAFLNLLVLPSHMRGCNVALQALIVATFLVNLIQFVNTSVWADDVDNVAPVWCDIATSFSLYYAFLAECAALCICKRLEWVSSPRSAWSSRPNLVMFEVTFCCILPLLSIPIRYISAPYRFAILEGWGCSVAVYPTMPVIALVFGPGIIITFASLVYAALAARNILRHQIAYQSHVRTSQCTLTKRRVTRLLILCLFMGSWPLFAVCIILRCFLSDGMYPWPGWAKLHMFFHHIIQVPLSLQPPEVHQARSVTFWIYIVTAYLTFAILVCGEDVQNDINRVWVSITRRSVSTLPATGPRFEVPVPPTPHSYISWSDEDNRTPSADSIKVGFDVEKLATVPVVLSSA